MNKETTEKIFRYLVRLNILSLGKYTLKELKDMAADYAMQYEKGRQGGSTPGIDALVDKLVTYDDEKCREAVSFFLADSSYALKNGQTVRTGHVYTSVRRMGSIPKRKPCKVLYVYKDRICIDSGGYALTERDFTKLFGDDPKELKEA